VVPVEKGQRAPRLRDKVYLGWIRQLPCLACLIQGLKHRWQPTEAAHIRCGYAEAGWRSTGMQEKPGDDRVAPLCGWHHRDGDDAQHKTNERAWWDARGVYPPDLCRDLRAAFPDVQAGEAVLRRYAEQARRTP
jgi:hypothetical protein